MFFKPRWNSANPVKARRAIEALTDQVEIAKAAQMALDPHNRRLAISKLTLQDVLWKIICEENDYSTRSQAVESLQDKTLLRELAENGAIEWRLRAQAWSSLGNKEQANYLHALHDENTQGRDDEKHKWQFSALDQIKSQQLLYSLATEGHQRRSAQACSQKTLRS